jgi:AcrR family transcriptional regulator
MSGRRTDTRERIQKMALDLFSEQGYEKTSLREIAERLGVTKAALYYHFKTKEGILASIVGDLAAEIDQLIDWAQAQPKTVQTRHEILRRLAILVRGPWRDVIRFGQANQAELSGSKVGEELGGRMLAVLGLVIDPAAELEDQIRAFLGLVAVYLANLPTLPGVAQLFGPDATEERRADAAMAVAFELVDSRR